MPFIATSGLGDYDEDDLYGNEYIPPDFVSVPPPVTPTTPPPPPPAGTSWDQFNPLAGSDFPFSSIIPRPPTRPPAATGCGISNPGACLTPVTQFVSANLIPILGGLALLFVLTAPFAPAGNIRPVGRRPR